MKSLLRKAGGTRKKRRAWLSIILVLLKVGAGQRFLSGPQNPETARPRGGGGTRTTGARKT